MDSVSLGIVREPMSIQVMEDLEGKNHYEKLIDLATLILADNTREIGFKFLNNVKSGMLDHFHSLKWLFQEIEALKEKNIQVTS